MEPKTATSLVSAADALRAWEAGEKIAAFQAEVKPERQTLVYGEAFALIAAYETHEALGTFHDFISRVGNILPLSDREAEVAHSIAYVAMKNGWARMVAEHTRSGHTPLIEISKP